MKEVLDQDESVAKRGYEDMLLLLVANGVILGGPILIWMSPFMNNIVRDTATSADNFIELLCISLVSIVLVLLLLQIKRLKRTLQKIKVPGMSFYLGTSIFLWSLTFFLNYNLHLNTYWKDVKVYGSGGYFLEADGSGTYKDIRYQFGGLAQQDKIEKDLCICEDKVGLKISVGLFGMKVNRRDYQAPEIEVYQNSN